jgi:hypothetical protein
MLRSSQRIHLLLCLSLTLLFSTLLGFFIGLSMPSTDINNIFYFSTYLSGFLTLWGLIIRVVVDLLSIPPTLILFLSSMVSLGKIQAFASIQFVSVSVSPLSHCPHAHRPPPPRTRLSQSKIPS